MPTISRIRLTNVIYENNAKRYNDQIFRFDGENGIFLLENGGGKTVFLQTVLQAVIPHAGMADRKIKETLVLDNSPAHIAIEWILNEKPRRYGVTAVSLYMENNTLKSYKYVYSHGGEDKNSIENMPFVVKNQTFKERPASKGEISDYYSRMKQQYINAETFNALKDYHRYIEENFKIIPSEWYKIATINSSEGGIEEFFKHCKTTQQLVNNLLIPTVEDALKGSEEIDFVQTFEKQREHFKQNKRLLEEIEQFQSIKDRVDHYVHEYSKLHKSEKDYNEVKLEAKAFSKFILEELEVKEKEKNHHEEEWIKYNKSLDQYEHKVLSLEVHKLDNEARKHDNNRNELQKQDSDTLQQLNEVNMRIQNIEITDLEEKHALHQQQIGNLEEQLQSTKQSEQESELREKVKDTLAYIHGSYINTLEDLTKERNLIEAQKDREADNVSGMKEKIYSKNNEIAESKANIKVLEASINRMQKQMEQIKIDIYEPFNENEAADYVRRVKERITDIEEEVRQSQARKVEIQNLVENLNGEQEKRQKELVETRADISKHEVNLSEMNKRQVSLIEELDSYFMNLGIFDSIYTKEPTIRQSVEDRLKKFENEFEEALTKERFRSRLADMYADIPFFAADSLVAKKLKQISNQVSYAEHGVVYLQKNINSLGGDEQNLYNKYPYWANTIVTTKQDKPKVREYIKGLNKDLSHPVIIVTTGDIQGLISEGVEDITIQNTVFPGTWIDNLKQDKFKSWKRETLKEASYAKSIREETSRKLQNIRRLKERVEEYFNRYPYKYYIDVQDEVKRLADYLKSLNVRISNISDAKYTLTLELDKINRRIDELNQEKPIITKRFELASDFIRIRKGKSEANNKKQEEVGTLEGLNIGYTRLQREFDRQESLYEEIKVALLNINHIIQDIKTDELYIKAKDTEAKYSDESRDILKDKLFSFEDRLRGYTGQSKEIMLKMNNEKEKLIDIENRLKRKKNNAKYPIEETKSYDDGEVDNLLSKSEKLSLGHEVLYKQVENEKMELAKIQGRREEKFQTIYNGYGELYVFEEELVSVERQLAEEKIGLKRQKKNLEIRRTKNNEMIDLYSKTKHRLELLAVEHGFAVMILKTYDKNPFINFEYDKDKMFINLMKKLEEKSLGYGKMLSYIEGKKKDFLSFCRSMIKEPKLKDTAIKGIEKKQDYTDLLEYQKNMEEILVRNIKIAEDDRRESDAELQTFLSHMMTYSKNVINEIDEIQNKTKIKVDDKSKQIFIFSIPKWDEISAKEELRKYINRLVVDYDREKEHRNEDKESIRIYIEDKLSVKNLIIRILGDKSIKIKCRKVTNDLKIGQAPMTWESSNKWSGGEKWSKNMTLFLSILNYLAEKKQYMSVTQKRHRTVILDNPFGKASSKHVLDPVFFVAENLGFQMITVTAHAEGQFVTDYFPVVYSGKLRSSSDPDKQIMDVVKTLNTAYFKSESPDTLMRFEESEQLSFLI